MSGQTISNGSQLKHICILRLSAIGDVCHAVAMVQAIQSHYPDAKITWVIGKVEAALLEGLEGVDFIIFDKNKGLDAFRQLRNMSKAREFDVLLHMQVAFRSSLASLCISAKKTVGFDRGRAKEAQWLFSDVKISPQRHPHVLEGFMEFARTIGVSCDTPVWQMPIGDEDESWALNEVEDNAPFVVISPAASKAERNWTAEGYAKIADHLQEKGFHTVLCGGPTPMERTLADEIKQRSNVPFKDLVGKTSLKQLLAVLKHAHFVLTPDTGPAHMAVTVNTPVIGLYAHSNPRRTGPYLYQKYVINHYDELVQAQYKKKWSDLPWGARVKGHDLMNRISVDEVKSKIDLLIQDFYPAMSAS